MVSKEKQEFQIRLKIRNKANEIKELSKRESLEITWENNKGILNPGELKTFTDEYGTHSYRKSKGKMVEFEKDGKKYNILVKINEIEKGWFKDKIKEFGGFSPIPGSDFTIINSAEKELVDNRERSFGEEDPDWKVKPTKLRWKGPILIGGIIIFLLLVIIIVFYYKNKKSSKT